MTAATIPSSMDGRELKPVQVQSLHDLRRSVRKATEREQLVDRELYRLFFLDRREVGARTPVDFSGSLDSALYLLQHALPGWNWHGACWVEEGQKRAKIQITRPKLMSWNFFSEPGVGAFGEASTPALALVDAVLAALIAQAPAAVEPAPQAQAA